MTGPPSALPRPSWALSPSGCSPRLRCASSTPASPATTPLSRLPGLSGLTPPVGIVPRPTPHGVLSRTPPASSWLPRAATSRPADVPRALAGGAYQPRPLEGRPRPARMGWPDGRAVRHRIVTETTNKREHRARAPPLPVEVDRGRRPSLIRSAAGGRHEGVVQQTSGAGHPAGLATGVEADPPPPLQPAGLAGAAAKRPQTLVQSVIGQRAAVRRAPEAPGRSPPSVDAVEYVTAVTSETCMTASV